MVETDGAETGIGTEIEMTEVGETKTEIPIEGTEAAEIVIEVVPCVMKEMKVVIEDQVTAGSSTKAGR